MVWRRQMRIALDAVWTFGAPRCAKEIVDA